MNRLQKRKLFCIAWGLAIASAFIFHYPSGSSTYRYPLMHASYVHMLSSGIIEHPLFGSVPLLADAQQSIVSPADWLEPIISSASNYPLLTSLYLVSTELLDITPYKLLRMPLGTILLPPAIYVAGREVLGKYGYLFAIFGTVYALSNPVGMNTYTATLTFPLFYLAVYALLKTARSKYSQSNVFVLLVPLLTFVIVLTWHTATMMTSIFVVTFVGVVFIQQLSPWNSISNRMWINLISISIIIIIITGTFLQIWQSTYVATLIAGLLGGGGESPIATFLGNFNSLLSGGPRVSVPYLFDYTMLVGGRIYPYTIYTLYGIVAIITITSCLLLIYRVINDRGISVKTSRAIILIASIGFAQVIFGVLYSGTSFGLVYIDNLILLFCSGAILLLIENKWVHRTVTLAFVVMIVLAAVLTGIIVITDNLGSTPETQYEETRGAAKWVADHADGRTVVVDFAVYSEFTRYFINHNTDFTMTPLQRLTSSSYAIAVGDASPDNLSGSLFVIDCGTMQNGRPVHAYNNRALLEPQIDKINSNEDLTLRYSDDSLCVYGVE